MLNSKRFWATVFGVATVIATKYFGVDDATISKITELVVVLISAFGLENLVKAATAKQ